MKKITESQVRDAWDALAGSVKTVPIVPEGGQTVMQLAGRLGLRRARASEVMRQWVDEGKVRKIGRRPPPSLALVYEVSDGKEIRV